MIIYSIDKEWFIIKNSITGKELIFEFRYAVVVLQGSW